jgi:hypothetical protein
MGIPALPLQLCPRTRRGETLRNGSPHFPPEPGLGDGLGLMNDAPAARMFGTHPKVLANHLAYGELVDATTNVSPEENVLVCLAPIARSLQNTKPR